jgi:hypothetical protein
VVVRLQTRDEPSEEGSADEEADDDEAHRERERPTDRSDAERPPCIGPRSTEKASHPARSSIMAEAMTSRPTSVLNKPRSRSVLAMTGRAEMDIATPMKRAKSIRRSGRTRSASGSRVPRRTPPTSGITMPKTLVSSALLPRRRTMPRLTSRPATTRSRTTPTLV